jgi:hypothetical protein
LVRELAEYLQATGIESVTSLVGGVDLSGTRLDPESPLR